MVGVFPGSLIYRPPLSPPRLGYAHEPKNSLTGAYPRNHSVHVRATRATRVDHLETVQKAELENATPQIV